MAAYVYVLGGALIFLALVLVAVILLQSSKDKSLSGTISGGSTETFFGKSKKGTMDAILSKVTIIVSVVFVILTVVLVVLLA